MKKFIIPVVLFATIISSCGSDAVEASKEQEVTVASMDAVKFNKVSEDSHIFWQAWHIGGVKERNGKVSISEAEISATETDLTSGKFTLDIAGLTVENFGEDTASNEKLRGHLTTNDFFLTDSFPTATFEITSVDTTSGDFNTIISGNLTIKGVTKNISFNSNVEITESSVSITSETFKVNRNNWGLSYHIEGSEGVPVDYIIANDIAFTINTTLTK